MLFIDIETLPDPAGPAQYCLAAVANKSLKDPEKVAADRAERGMKAWKATSLDPLRGITAVVCFAVDDGPVETLVLDQRGERVLYESLASRLASYGVTDQSTVCGYNIIGFDGPWMSLRGIKYRLNNLARLFRPPRYPTARYIDPMYTVSNGRINDFESQDVLAEWLGLPAVDKGIDGGQVAETWMRGGANLVAKKCAADVEQLRDIYHLMHNGGWL
jgi:hypothetical protein